MIEERMKEILSDSQFARSLLEMDTVEEVQDALSKKGVELSKADIEAIRLALDNPEDSELNDEDLVNVAGGSLTVMAAIGIASIIGAACGGTVTLGNAVSNWTRRRW